MDVSLDFNQERAYDLLSAMHKFVRRQMPIEAMLAGRELCGMAPSMFWAEAKVIAVEDVAQPLEICAVDALARQYLELGRDNQRSKGRLWAMDAMKILAEAKKDRRADELLHQSLPLPDQLPDFVYDKHTAQGRKLGRGEEHFEEIGSYTVNKSEEYEKWRAGSGRSKSQV